MALLMITGQDSSIIYFHILIYLQRPHVILLSSPEKSSFVIFIDVKDVGSSR